MDRHDVSSDVTAEHVAQLHQEDLKIEEQFDCKGMTYWFDAERKTAFCLIKAPNKEAVCKMHDFAHGVLPHKIIEVDETIVESFLGRIEDPKKTSDTEINIIDDPAFRCIMYLELSHNSMERQNNYQYSLFSEKIHQSIIKTFKKYEGRVVQSDNESYLASFKSISNAISCAFNLQHKLKFVIPKFEKSFKKVKIGLSAGLPVEEKAGLFEDTVNLSKTICQLINSPITITNDVRVYYEKRHTNDFLKNELVQSLNLSEEAFIKNFTDCLEKIWNDPNFQIQNFAKLLGYSQSQFYRKVKSLTGKSPVQFLSDYKLDKSIEFIHHKKGNISEIAFDCGFNSPSYFSKCFFKKYHILPSQYQLTC
ncbi:nickel-binding protein [Namhaeicola litoreus]|uniref:Nickel-binding protein n=1 Tax=Namhaeicola litoreus TaxID=1052145 RepID=A0ABW3Y501_9FLAO